MPFPGGLWWLLCCRQGFTLLRRDYGEADREADGEAEEEEASFELRAQGDQGSLEVNLSQPTRSSSGSERSLLVAEEMRSLIVEKGPEPVEDDPDALVKGWLQREVRGGVKTPWIRPRKYWFVLTPDSLDYYSSNEKGARRLGSLVLTSLCSVLWPDKQTYKETGYWNVTVFGRKHCYRLYTEHLNEAVHWVCAVQKVIDSKVPVQTPTQLLMRDVEEHCGSPEVLEQIYRCNPILRYTSSPLYAPLLPFPYGSLDQSAPGPRSYTTLRDEAVKLFNSLQQLESERDPVPLMQGVLQTCLDLPPLVDEIYCQLVKQTTEPLAPGGQGDLHYWQLLTCMSCTFLPSPPVLRFLRFHLDRTESRFPASEMAKYACFIREALGKTKGRECVPSLEEILVLMQRQEMICTVHCPGAPACSVAISSHTTAEEVARELVSRLGLSQSPNLFALYEQSRRREQPVGSTTLLADVLTRFENLAGEEREQDPPCRLCFKHYGFLDTDNVPRDSLEFALLFEQAHEMVLRGYVPTSEETLQTLAALRLQSLNSDFSTHAPFPRLEELFPPHVLHARLPAPRRRPPTKCRGARLRAGLLAGGLWGQALAKQRAERDQRLRGRLREEGASTMAAIVEKWKLLQGMGRPEAMAAYVALVREWPGFGSTLFDVDLRASPVGAGPQRLWLGIGAKAVSLYKPGEPEPLDSFCYGRISSFGASDSSTFRLSVEDRDLLFETSQVRGSHPSIPPSPSGAAGCRPPRADQACPLCLAGGRDRPAPQHVPRLRRCPAATPAPGASHQLPRPHRATPGALPRSRALAAPATCGLLAQLAQWPAWPCRVLPTEGAGRAASTAASGRSVLVPSRSPEQGDRGSCSLRCCCLSSYFLNLFRDACAPPRLPALSLEGSGAAVPRSPHAAPRPVPVPWSPVPRCLRLQHACCLAALPAPPLLPPPGALPGIRGCRAAVLCHRLSVRPLSPPLLESCGRLLAEPPQGPAGSSWPSGRVLPLRGGPVAGLVAQGWPAGWCLVRLGLGPSMLPL